MGIDTLSSGNTYGPAFEWDKDYKRIEEQYDRIYNVMWDASARSEWLTLAEIEVMTGDPQASISAQLRHMRKEMHGGHTVSKRRRVSRLGTEGGTFEYQVWFRDSTPEVTPILQKEGEDTVLDEPTPASEPEPKAARPASVGQRVPGPYTHSLDEKWIEEPGSVF